MAVLLDAVGGVSGDDTAVVWLQTPYGIVINEDPQAAFKNIESYVKSILRNGDSDDSATQKNITEWMSIANHTDNKNAGYNTAQNVSMHNQDASLVNGKPLYTAPNYTDTRVGGNDAINPYWQFNRDDDITPPMFSIGGGDDNRFYSMRGMGRVYAETYDANQRVLWLQMGVPEFRNIATILMRSGDSAALQAMTQGSLASLGVKILRMVVKGALWFITFPITAPLFAMRWMTTFGTNDITKFYRFRPSMPLYFDMVNAMLAYLAVSMGIYPQYMVQKGDTRNSHSKLKNQYSMADTTEHSIDATGKAKTITETDIQNSSIPEILKNGPDIYIMLNRRAILFQDALKHVSTRDLLANQQSNPKTKGGAKETAHIDPNDPHGHSKKGNTYFHMLESEKGKVKGARRSETRKYDKNALERAFGALKSTMYGTFDFVGFKVEKGVSTSESISSSTTTSPLFEKLNEKAREKQSENNSSGNSYGMKKIMKLISSRGDAKGVLKDIGIDALAKMGDALGITAAASIINSGNGFFEVPEMWQDSKFSKSQSFTVNLRSRYGDPVSIYQSIYVPLMMLFAAACPRSVGDNMYTQPFLVKAYCKGMFSVACGIIDSLTITRGKDEFGWNNQLLPTAVDVQVSIKDLSPVMFLAMQDIGFFDTFSRNESMLEYLDTLSALTIRDRMYELPRAARKFSAAVLIKKNTIFSPEWWGVKAGSTGPGNLFSNMNPWMPVAHEQSDMTRDQ